MLIVSKWRESKIFSRLFMTSRRVLLSIKCANIDDFSVTIVSPPCPVSPLLSLIIFAYLYWYPDYILVHFYFFSS